MILGGREIVAFVEISELGSNHIKSIDPVPKDGSGGLGYAFGDGIEGSVQVWGIKSQRGRRIRAAYQAGELPTNEIDELNRVLRPDEFEQEVDGE